MNPLNWLADRWLFGSYKPRDQRVIAAGAGHRLGFRRGYAVGAVTGVLVAFAYHALTP